MRLSIVCAIVVGVFCGTVSAAEDDARQDPLRLARGVSGIVLNADDAARVPGAEVRLQADGVVSARATTDAEGRFSLRAAPGRYTLAVAGRLHCPVIITAEGGAGQVRILLPSEEGAPAGAADFDEKAWYYYVVPGVVVLGVPTIVVVLAATDNLRSSAAPRPASP